MEAGRYKLLEELGRGGMGKVYRARDTVTGATVALKQMNRIEGDDRKAHRDQLRLQQEFQTLAGLKHPHIVEAYAFGYHENVPFYTMELLDGQDLKSLGPLKPQQACKVLREVASALSLLHARGLLHRDLAPCNVHCTAQGTAKLLDFGILCSMGIHDDPVGTPPFMAPENLQGIPLDQRADIFGLGALAYWLLTGKNAFPGKLASDLKKLWRQRPADPSSLEPGVETSLDELVISMLSIDPGRRPANMAVITNRLGAFLDTEVTQEVAVESAFLASSTMVGRDSEMAAIKRRLSALCEGEGGVLFIESPLGGGKSRLLKESELEAQLVGLTPLAVNASNSQGPFSVFQQVASQLLDLMLEPSLASARARAGRLIRVVPQLAEHLESIAALPLEGDAAQDRARLQEEVTQWLLEIAESQPLLLLVDDIHRCDEASATIFASLALNPSLKNILILVAARTDEALRAPAAVQALQDSAVTLPLHDLSHAEVKALTIELLGDSPEIEMVATSVSSLAGDTPMHYVEMVRHLVEIEALRHHEGVWIIDAARLEAAGVPQSLAGMFELQVSRLSASARSLLEVISVYRGRLELEDCLWLLHESQQDEILDGLNELLSTRVLMSASGTLRFRHDGLRQACLRLLDAERQRELHLHVGTMLERQGAHRTAPEEVGWHLLEGGELSRAAEYLERGGRSFYEMYAFGEALQPLEQALKIYEDEASHPRQRAELLYMLVQGGTLASRETVTRYAKRAIDVLWSAAGLDLAAPMARWFGRPAALVLGLLGRAMARLFTSPKRRGMPPLEALTKLGTVFGACIPVYAVPYHLDQVNKLLERFEPLFQTIKHPATQALQYLVESMLDFQLAHYGKVRSRTQQILELLQDRRMAKISEIDRKNIEGAARYLRGMLFLIERDTSSRAEIERLDELEMHFHSVSASVLRIADHIFRGDEILAREQEKRLLTLMLQMGSVWQMETQLTAIFGYGYGHSGDLVGLKRTIEKFESYTQRGYNYRHFLELFRGEYHRLRGEFDLARAALERCLEALPPETLTDKKLALTVLAEVELAEGLVDRALDFAQRALQVYKGSEETQHFHLKMRTERVIALAEAKRGQTSEAIARIQELIVQYEKLDLPSCMSMLHEVLAYIALEQGEIAAYKEHRQQMETALLAVDNSMFLERLQKLENAYARQELQQSSDSAEVLTMTVPHRPLRSSFTGAEMVLYSLIEMTGSQVYLFLREGDELELVADKRENAPDETVVSAMHGLLGGTQPPNPLAIESWNLLPMIAHSGAQRLLVGGVAIHTSGPPPSPHVLRLMAEKLHRDKSH